MTAIGTESVSSTARPALPISGDPPHAVDAYAAINSGLTHLREHPTHFDSAWTVCRAYVSLGLYGPARELLSDPRGPLVHRRACLPLAEKIARKPSGRVAWGALRG